MGNLRLRGAAHHARAALNKAKASKKLHTETEREPIE